MNKAFRESLIVLPALFLTLAIAMVAMPANALPVEGLYNHELPVANQGDAERRRAYREALAAVILKVTGETRWLQRPQVQTALQNAQSFVEEVGFRTGVRQVPAVPDQTGADLDDVISPQLVTQPAIFINVRFSRTLIDDLLDAANIPIWDRNRPTVLVWISIQSANGQRSLLGSDSEHQILEVIQEFSRQRGVPFLIPVLDFVDRRSLPVADVWSLNQDAIRAASARYGADSILAGRILVTPAGELVGLWQFQFRDNVETFDAVDSEISRYMQLPLDRVVGRLAGHFSIVRNTLQSNETVMLRVDGIQDIASFESLVSYVRELAVVRNVELARLDGATLELNVALSGTRTHLREFLSLDRDFAVVETGANLGERDFLHYRWTR